MAKINNIKAKKIAVGSVRTVGSVIGLIFKILGSVILVVLTTGLIFACIFAMYVKNNLATDLDLALEDFIVDVSSVMYYKDPDSGNWEELVTLQNEEFRILMEYEDIPLTIEHALVAIEDQRFYTHNGVDWYRTSGAFVNMFIGMRNTFGGSTITQQLIKNLTKEDDVTVQRKLTEMFRAMELEKNYEKDEIIEWYLNVVYFGHGCYGIGAASQYYFGKDLSALTLAESASLIGITNNPSKFSPYSYPENNKDRQEVILYEMKRQGYISQEEYDDAVAEKLVFQRGEENKHENVVYTWFEEAVISEAIADLQEVKGCSYSVARHLLYNGGYKIYTTLNPDIQAAIDSVYKDLDNLPAISGSSAQAQSAIVIMDPYTGDVVGLSGGVGEKTANLLRNRATVAQRQPGSSIKPLTVYAPAMDMGYITSSTKFNDSPNVVLSGKPDWLPRNDSGGHSGIMTVKTAITRSINTVAAQILDKVTPAASYKFATEKLGLSLRPEDNDYAPLALGGLTVGVSVMEMTSAYTMFPNMGLRTEPRTYTRILDVDDNLVCEKNTSTVTAISDTTAYWMNDLLQNAATYGTGHESKLANMPTAGKTGTTSDKKDRWFVGYTPYYVAGVWTGYDTPAVMKVSGNPAAQIWKRVMTVVHEGLEYKEFQEPSTKYQQAVPGIDEVVSYTVKYVTVANDTLVGEGSGTGIAGEKMTVPASVPDGFVLDDAAEKEITLSLEPEKNVVWFNVLAIDPPTDEPIDTDDPNSTDDPNNPPVTDDPNNTGDPNNTPDPGNTDDPGSTDNPGTTDDPGNTGEPTSPPPEETPPVTGEPEPPVDTPYQPSPIV